MTDDKKNPRFIVTRTVDGRWAVTDTVRGTMATGMKDKARAQLAADNKNALFAKMQGQGKV